MKYLGIDPGVSGGVAIIKGSSTISSYKCPKTTQEMADLIIKISDKKTKAIIEKVNRFPGQWVVSTFTFGSNYGQWLGILSALRIEYELITPRTWQKKYQPLSKVKKDRKNELKNLAKSSFPKENVTLYTADAILLALYLKEEGKNAINKL